LLPELERFLAQKPDEVERRGVALARLRKIVADSERAA
jgi:hypothetical protein